MSACGSRMYWYCASTPTSRNRLVGPDGSSGSGYTFAFRPEAPIIALCGPHSLFKAMRQYGFSPLRKTWLPRAVLMPWLMNDQIPFAVR